MSREMAEMGWGGLRCAGARLGGAVVELGWSCGGAGVELGWGGVKRRGWVGVLLLAVSMDASGVGCGREAMMGDGSVDGGGWGGRGRYQA